MLISLNCVGQYTAWDSVDVWSGRIFLQHYIDGENLTINQSYYNLSDSFVCPDFRPLPETKYLSEYLANNKPHYVTLTDAHLDSCRIKKEEVGIGTFSIRRKTTDLSYYFSEFDKCKLWFISLMLSKHKKNKIIFPAGKNSVSQLQYDADEKKIIFKGIKNLTNLNFLTVWSFRPDSTPQINRQNIAKDFFSLPSLSAVIVDSAYSFKILKNFKRNSNIKLVQISLGERGKIGKIPKGMLKSEKLELVRVKVESLSDELIEELNKFDGRVKIGLTVEKLRKGDCDKLLQLKGLLGVISDDISDLLKENDISEIIRLIEKVKVPELSWYWGLRYKEYSDIPTELRIKFDKIAELVNEKMKKFGGTPPSE